MLGREKYTLLILLISLLTLICLPVKGEESSSHDLVIRILPYTEAILDRQVSDEIFQTGTTGSPGVPFISNDLQSKRVTAFAGIPSMFGLSRDMEFEITSFADFCKLSRHIKPENILDDIVEITCTITDL